MPPKRVNLKDINTVEIFNKIKNGEKQRKLQKKENNDLFDNPMIDNAKEGVSEEQQEKWKKLGENLHSVDFVNEKGDNVKDKPSDEIMKSVVYIVDSICNGMHISFLEDNEKEILASVYGDEWWKLAGYEKEDLDDIVNYPDTQYIENLKIFNIDKNTSS